jgi:hypothetical protein
MREVLEDHMKHSGSHFLEARGLKRKRYDKGEIEVHSFGTSCKNYFISELSGLRFVFTYNVLGNVCMSLQFRRVRCYCL